MKKLFLGADNVAASTVKPNYEKAEKALGDLLDALAIDWREDPNMQGTPKRVAKMYIEEIMQGRYVAPPAITDFSSPHKDRYSILVSGPWSVRSLCSHHLMPVTGFAYIGLLPTEGSKLAGLSKYGRIVDWFARRPQLQEDLVEDIANYLDSTIKPEGLGVYLKASHSCCTFRGIKSGDSMFTTTALRGSFLSEPSLKDEFLRECYSNYGK